MKKILPVFSALVMAATSLYANSTRSASFYLNTPEKYEGKKIVLYVAEVDRTGSLEGSDSILFSAYTMTRDGDESSYISVIVPKNEADSFARRYGSDYKYVNGKIKTRQMSGILRQINDTWFLEYGGE